MKYIQDESTIKLLLALIFVSFMTFIAYILSKKSKSDYSKIRVWRVYIIAGIGLFALLSELFKRLFKT